MNLGSWDTRSVSKPARHAFVLVEALMAALIIGIGVAAIYGGISFGYRCIEATRENLRGQQLLSDTMETMRLYTWTQITNGTSIPTKFTNSFNTLGSANAGRGVSYTGTVTFANPPFTNELSGNLKQVTVQVSWVSANVLRTRQITTLVSSNGLQSYIY